MLQHLSDTTVQRRRMCFGNQKVRQPAVLAQDYGVFLVIELVAVVQASAHSQYTLVVDEWRQLGQRIFDLTGFVLP